MKDEKYIADILKSSFESVPGVLPMKYSSK